MPGHTQPRGWVPGPPAGNPLRPSALQRVVAAATVAPDAAGDPRSAARRTPQGVVAPEQGGPVLNEALGIAERARGERHRISDTHDYLVRRLIMNRRMAFR